MKKILVLNPGSTSTKLAMFDGDVMLWQRNIEHSAVELEKFDTIFAQLDMRTETVLEAMKLQDDRLDELVCIMSRGGLLPPLPSGAYAINDEMLDVLEHRPMNHHASNLGAAIAYRLAKPFNIPALIYDPVTVDEMIDLVRVTGLKQVRRHGQGHSLNMRAAALRYSKDCGGNYSELSLIVVHLGGGFTLSLHHKGRIIDMVSDDEGPFSGERAGLIPCYKLVKLAFTEGYDYNSLMKLLQRGGGLISLLNESDVRAVEERVKRHDEEAALIYEAMALSVSRSIASLATVVNGCLDQIILTGGVAHSEMFSEMISKRVQFIAPICRLPGENEMQALADGALRVLSGEEHSKEYFEPACRPF